MPRLPHPFGSTRSVHPLLLVGRWKGTGHWPCSSRTQPNRTGSNLPSTVHTCQVPTRCLPPALTATKHHSLSLSLSLQISLSLFPTAFLPHTSTSSSPSEPMTPAKIAIIFSIISSLLLVSHARFVPDDIFPLSTAVSKQDPPEDTDRTAVVLPLEKTTHGSISAAVEPFHYVDISLRRPIGRHIIRPINPHFLLRLRHGCRGHRHGRPGGREIPYGDDMIAFPRGPKIPRGFPGEMRSIPTMGPRIPRGFPNEKRPMPTGRTEFERGFRKETAAMAHGMREAEGHQVAGEEKMRVKHGEEEEQRKDGDFAKRFWAILNRV